MNTISSYEEKAIIDALIERFKKILNLNVFEDAIDGMISQQYHKALQEVDNQFDLPLNIVPNNRDLRFLQEYVTDNIGQATDQIGEALRQEIQRGILNEDSKQDLVVRVKKMFKDNKYQTRLKTILRTETLRANNKGILEGAKQAANTGLKITKWLDVVMDDRTSDICKAENKKYGTPKEAIPLKEEFKVRVANKSYKAQAPPFHINCRTVVRLLTA